MVSTRDPPSPLQPSPSLAGNDKHSLLNECHLLHLNLIVFLTNLIIKMEIKSLLLLKQIVPYNCALMVGSGFTEKNLKNAGQKCILNCSDCKIIISVEIFISEFLL